jgi:hypothetical protein
MGSDAGPPAAPDEPGDHRATSDDAAPPLWFAKKDQGFPITALTWQGRAATFLYFLLVVLAVFTYSRLTLTAFVIAFYTVVFVLLVAYKSDLLEDWPPGS